MFVIVNPLDGTLYHKQGHYSYATYETLHGANIAASKLRKQARKGMPWVAVSYDEFNRLWNPEVDVVSLMSGKTVKIRKSDVGGCCDPSTERYWSM